jgi:hypothetical protein
VNAASYERTLDRFLAVVSYEGESLLFVLNSLVVEFVNRTDKAVATMESAETWTTEDGTVAADTDHYAYGTQGRKFTASASGTATARHELGSPDDLTAFDDGNVSVDEDKVTVHAFVDNAQNLASIRVRFVKQSGATYTDYFEATVSTGFRNGWNQLVIAKEDFAATGSPAWDDVAKMQLRVTANANGDVVVTMDDCRMIPSDGFTLKSILSANVTLQYVRFNYEQVSEAMRQIARLVGYEWYIDADRDIHFFPPSLTSAPFSVEDDNGVAVPGSLVVKNDITNLRNVIYIRGGDEIGATQEEDVSSQANGNNVIFNLGYKYTNLSVTVNGTPQTVGIDFIDDPASFDLLYNFEEKTLRFTVAPAGGDDVIVTDNPYIPIIVKKRDAASISTYGTYEFQIVDKTIRTREAARQRGQADLTAYRADLNEGEFLTFTAGLHAGMAVVIDSALRGLAESFVVNRVTISMRGPNEAQYHVVLVTTRTYGIIEYLLGQLRQAAKELDIGEDEVLDVTETYEEEVGVSEVVTVATATEADEEVGIGEDHEYWVDDPPEWVAGPYSPTDLRADRKRPMFTDRDNLLP